MNKLTGVFFVITTSLSTLLLNASAHAEEALTKPFVKQYAQTAQQINKLIKMSPGAEEQFSDLMLKDRAEALSRIKSLPNYEKFKSIITKNGFQGTEDYIDTSLRLMGAAAASKMKEMPDGVTIDDFANSLKNQLDQFKKKDLPPEALKELESQFKEQLNSINRVKTMAENASEADVDFMTENKVWVEQLMPAAEETPL
ncbi:hypothetical protein [Colwellia sp. E2M01]|uniref:hypothetical protein n=1 Tax=Colwellia sp. E2M01 TaxID=2841561 RepID=UPI001C0A4421|nr:hypothetical protein [Colwellia sp. E2M01]MBU2871509.1 hypothetical protein [Colwellia sp. E2M01]